MVSARVRRGAAGGTRRKSAGTSHGLLLIGAFGDGVGGVEATAGGDGRWGHRLRAAGDRF